jgi:hypothetical protein
MIEQGTSQKEEKKTYKVILILLIGLAAISGARKDLNQLLSLAHDVHALADHWVVGMVPTGQAPTVASAETCQAKVRAVVATTSEFRWRGRVEQRKAMVTKRLSRVIQPESDTGMKRITLY